MAEVLIASFVLTIGLLVTAALISASVKYSFDNRDTIVAVELAQEGVELVRNVRDNNFAAGDSAFKHFSNSKEHCHMDYNDDPANLDNNCSNFVGAFNRYYLQYQGGFYGDYNNQPERYSRYIYINYDNAVGNENSFVRSFVFWGVVASDFSLVEVGSNGDASGCTSARKCVFTEIKLTDWKL